MARAPEYKTAQPTQPTGGRFIGIKRTLIIEERDQLRISDAGAMSLGAQLDDMLLHAARQTNEERLHGGQCVARLDKIEFDGLSEIVEQLIRNGNL